MTAYELALAVCKALDGKNARDIGIIKVEGRSDITDYFVVASGNSVTHVRALGEETEFQLISLSDKSYFSPGQLVYRSGCYFGHTE